MHKEIINNSLSNIQDVAKEHGLDYNNDNIIVVK